jgi:hypothetical protein
MKETLQKIMEENQNMHQRKRRKAWKSFTFYHLCSIHEALKQYKEYRKWVKLLPQKNSR